MKNILFLSKLSQGIINVVLKFKQVKDHGQLIGYVDSDFAGDLDQRCSTTWCLFILVRGRLS